MFLLWLYIIGVPVSSLIFGFLAEGNGAEIQEVVVMSLFWFLTLPAIIGNYISHKGRR